MQIHDVKLGALAAAFLLAASPAALAQVSGGVRQSGPVTAGHCAAWVTNNTIQDGGACGGTVPVVVSGNVVTGTGTGIGDSGVALASLAPLASPNFTGNPSLSTATATSLAIGGAAIGSDALAVTGTATVSGATTLGNINVTSSTIPANGIYLSAANTLSFAAGGAIGSSMSSAGTFASATSGGYSLIKAAGSATVPNIRPNNTSTSAGIGDDAAGDVSIITSSLEAVRVASTGLISLLRIGSDATHTDASICEDTTSHALYSGSGTLGVCLGTSSARYKNTITDLDMGLDTVMALKPKSYFYNADAGDGGVRLQFGFLAEDAQTVTPTLVGLDVNGAPNTFDLIGVIPILVHAIQQQQAEIAALQAKQN